MNQTGQVKCESGTNLFFKSCLVILKDAVENNSQVVFVQDTYHASDLALCVVHFDGPKLRLSAGNQFSLL